MYFIANTTERLSRWVSEAMATLTTERDRAHALHRENAQLSRETTIAHKEVMSLEAKLFHSGRKVRKAGA